MVLSLPVEIRVASTTPYGDLVPVERLTAIFTDLFDRAALMIERAFFDDEIDQASFGLCVLDPTAPLWKPSRDCVLATAAIGEKGRQYVMNAVAKAVSTRDVGEEWGKVLYTQPHRIPGEAFRWGYAAIVDDTIVGGSALAEKDDQRICQLTGVHFNSDVHKAIEDWIEDHPRQKPDGSSHSWFNNSGVAPGWLQDHWMTAFDGDLTIRLNAD